MADIKSDMGAYDAVIGRCSTASARGTSLREPQFTRTWAVSQLLTETLEGMKLTYPNPHLDIKALETSLGLAA